MTLVICFFFISLLSGMKHSYLILCILRKTAATFNNNWILGNGGGGTAVIQHYRDGDDLISPCSALQAV